MNIVNTEEQNKQQCELQEYRKKQNLLFNLKKKYSVLLELNKNKRYEWILTNFAKKRILFSVCNMSNEEIKEIPSIYRYRCYLYEPNQVELFNLNCLFESQMEIIKNENDRELKEILLETLIETRKKQMNELLKAPQTQKIPIMLDLRIYGNDPTLPIIFEEKIYELDELTKVNIKLTYDKVNESTHTGQRFRQMINHSKILRNSYNKIK